MAASSTPSQLTADLIARAIVAAALAYGDDPVKAFTAKRGAQRRCMTPAANGVAQAVGLPFYRVASVLGLRAQNLCRSRSAGGEAFVVASAAAERAARYAAWRPEARASVVAGMAEDAIPKPPSARRVASPPKSKAKQAPASKAPPPPEPKRCVDLDALSAGDVRHLRQVVRANSGRGFPALAAR